MILITGASGNVGREVLRQTAAAGAKVRAAYQSAAKAADAPRGVEIATVDYNRPETLRAALDGVERVFLVGPPTADLVALERNAVDVIAQSDVSCVVKLSAMGGRGAIFPGQHADSEDYIRSTGVPYTFLRPNGFMQNLINFSASTITSQNAFYGSEGEGRVSLIDIRDIAAVAVKTLTEDGYEGEALTLTGPEAVSNQEVARTLSDTLGREIRFINLPPDQFKQALISAGVPEWSANALVDLQRFYREGNAATVTDDVERVLGRKPIALAQFVLEYRSAFEPRGQGAGS
jgi:uncharacterized protein YbjT (DUF2867 family)